MGNFKFRFSDMIPIAWFYKLKDMKSTRPKNHNTSQHHHHSTKQQKPTSNEFPPPQKSHISQTRRYSYYLSTQPNRENRYYNSPIHPKASDTHFPANPRKPSTRTSKRKAVYKPSPNKSVSKSSSNCNCHAAVNSVWTDDESHRTIPSPDYFGSTSEPDFHELIPSEFVCDLKFANMKNEGCTGKIHDQKLDGFDFDMISEVELPPILTKPVKCDEGTKFKRSSSKVKEIQGQRSLTVKIVKEESIRTQKGNQRKVTPNSVRKASLSSTGIRLRGNSPRLGSKKKTQPCDRKSVSSSPSSCLKSKNRRLSESFAVVKTSVDPQRDFRESMMEMIVENNIRAAKDLEDLLACYLSLNSNEYHDLIVKAFEQIWFDVARIKMILTKRIRRNPDSHSPKVGNVLHPGPVVFFFLGLCGKINKNAPK